MGEGLLSNRGVPSLVSKPCAVCRPSRGVQGTTYTIVILFLNAPYTFKPQLGLCLWVESFEQVAGLCPKLVLGIFSVGVL